MAGPGDVLGQDVGGDHHDARPGSAGVPGQVPASQVSEELAGQPDRLRWNARYTAGFTASFAPHLLAAGALQAGLPDGPVLELACGPSGSALLAAEAGRRVIAVDVSDVALALLGAEAQRRGIGERIALIQADLTTWRPQRGDSAGQGRLSPQGGYALVLCTGYWERAVFAAAADAVAPAGLLAWEAFTADARRARPGLRPQWCLGPGSRPRCCRPVSRCSASRTPTGEGRAGSCWPGAAVRAEPPGSFCSGGPGCGCARGRAAAPVLASVALITHYEQVTFRWGGERGSRSMVRHAWLRRSGRGVTDGWLTIGAQGGSAAMAGLHGRTCGQRGPERCCGH